MQTAKVYQNGRSQAIRLPKDFRLETDEVYLKKTLETMLEAFANERPEEPVAELVMLYSIGDLHLRLGSPTDSVKWLAQASQHPEFKKQAEIQKMTRDRWLDARSAVRPKA